jgi:hypothetical protein
MCCSFEPVASIQDLFPQTRPENYTTSKESQFSLKPKFVDTLNDKGPCMAKGIHTTFQDVFSMVKVLSLKLFCVNYPYIQCNNVDVKNKTVFYKTNNKCQTIHTKQRTVCLACTCS